MPFCPVCGDEFEDWVKECPDDKVPLVDELPPAPESLPDHIFGLPYMRQPGQSQEPLVHIATAPNEPIGKMWEDILQENNILCLLRPVSTGGWTIYTPHFEMRHQLYVLESSAEQAKEILLPFTEEFNGGEEN